MWDGCANYHNLCPENVDRLPDALAIALVQVQVKRSGFTLSVANKECQS